jgi:hypothetical protein
VKAKVYVKFPKAGLGNKLLTWSRAYVFAELNGLELHTSSWFSWFVGAWLRNEQKKRLYIGYFKKKGLLADFLFFCYRLFYKKIEEPNIEKINLPQNKTLYVFDKTFRTFDFYAEIRPFKALVKEGLFKMLTPAVKKAYENAEKPVIAMHIRRGDFKIANPITPLSFFIEVLTEIRTQAGKDLPVTVFSDANEEELKPILQLPNAQLATQNADIVDLLLLARSQYLLTSISSTFSYWAAFLSEGVIIKPAEEWHEPLRDETDPLSSKEIIWTGLSLSTQFNNSLN